MFQSIKQFLVIIILFSTLSCYNGLNDMYDDLTMKVPICVNSMTGNDANDGRGWANAKQTIQGAIDSAQTDDVIWIAGEFSVNTVLRKSVSIFGGFNGSESRRDQRDMDNKTIISGTVSPVFDIQSTGIVIDGLKFTKTSGNSISVTTSSCSALVSNCEFTKNTSISLFLTTGSLEISKCFFYNNSASTIAAANCSVVISNSNFNSNTLNPGSGGAINTSLSSISIKDSEFRGNTVTVAGGAIYAPSGNSILISATDFIDNYSNSSGGAILVGDGSSISITGGVFSGNRANSTGALGGGVCAIDSTGNISVVLKDVSFISNYSFAGGGAINIAKRSGDTLPLTINGCNFTGNNTISEGGAVYLNLSQGNIDTIKLQNCSFNKNYASSGGAVYITGTSSADKVSMTGCTFGIKDSDADGNYNTSGQGGALYTTRVTLNLNDTAFYNNHSVTDGGGIFTGDGCILTLNNCDVYGNKITTVSENGGGIFIDNGTCNIINSRVNNNSTYLASGTAAGGGIYSAATCIITGTEISDNKAWNGGGIANIDSGINKLTLINCLMTGNSADSSSGLAGAIYIRASDCSIDCSTLINNTAGSTSHGIFALRMDTSFSNLGIHNSIIWSDEPIGAVNRFLYYTRFNVSVSSNCIIDDPSVGTGGTSQIYSNIKTNPSFTDLLNGNYTLTAQSPCVNSGNSSAVPSGVTLDFVGKPRITGGTVDMGCYERQ